MEHNTLEGLADLLRDPVTGLYNRDGFVTLGGRALDMAMRSGSTLVLLCAQIENLSALQEEFGPGAKEQAVREAAGLPAAAANASEETVPHAPAPSLAEMRGTETLLLTEDHESIREMARQALVNLGYRVLSAADGEEALRLCQTERPALAILDVVMPKVGGLAAAERLAARFENLPILFTSGYSQDCQGMEAVSASGRYLQKPYSPMSLGRVVREIVDKSQAATSPP
jgi:CheY-like chemotaxis protein